MTTAQLVSLALSVRLLDELLAPLLVLARERLPAYIRNDLLLFLCGWEEYLSYIWIGKLGLPVCVLQGLSYARRQLIR